MNCREQIKIGLVTMLLIAINVSSASAAIVEDLQNPELTVRSAVERALSSSTEVDAILTEGLPVVPDKVGQLVSSVVAANPGAIQNIVQTSLRSGVSSEVIADQCRSALTPRQIETLVRTAIREQARPETIMETCLTVVGPETASDLVAAALESVDPALVDRVIASSYDTLSAVDSDPEILVARGMVQARLMVGTEIVDEPLAIRMLQSLEGIDSEQAVLVRREAEAVVLRITEGQASAN